MKAPSVFLLLGSAYLWSVPFVKILHFPGVPTAFQLPEIIFLLLLVLALVHPNLRTSLATYKFDLLDYSVLGLVASQLLAAVAAGEVLGQTAPYIILYLGSWYFLGKLILQTANFSVVWLTKSVGILGVLLVGSVLFSWGYQHWLSAGTLVLTEEKYLPGLGWKQRIMAFTMSPNMLLNLFLLPLMLSFAHFIQKRTIPGLLLTGILLAAAIATWSKSLLLLGFGLVVIGLVSIPWPGLVRKLLLLSCVVLIAFMLVPTKFLVINKHQADRDLILNQSYATTDLIAEVGEREVYESMHYRLNQEAVLAFCSSPLWGIGPGQFIKHLEERQLAGAYPRNKQAYAPHSLYLGTLAQSGLLGFTALAVFIFALWRKWRNLWQRVATEHRWLVLGLGVYGMLWLVDGLSMDTLHFRHFWWVVIVIAAWEYQLRIIPPQRQRDTEVH